MKLQETLSAYWQDVAAQRAEELAAYFQPEAVIRWHNTDEQFTVAEFIRANCEYPGLWEGTVERYASLDDGAVTVTRVWNKEKSAAFHVTSFFRIQEGIIAALDEYWGDDGPPPQWRIEKQIGTNIQKTL